MNNAMNNDSITDDVIIKPGQPASHVVWVKKGQTTVDACHLSSFHAAGLSARAYNGFVYNLRDVKVARTSTATTAAEAFVFGLLSPEDYALNVRPEPAGPSPFAHLYTQPTAGQASSTSGPAGAEPAAKAGDKAHTDDEEEDEDDEDGFGGFSLFDE